MYRLGMDYRAARPISEVCYRLAGPKQNYAGKRRAVTVTPGALPGVPSGTMARDPALWLAIGRNAVSALARDLLVDRMFALEDAGFPIVFTVHDGIVCEHPQITQEGIEQIMSIRPRWAEKLGVPVKPDPKLTASKRCSITSLSGTLDISIGVSDTIVASELDRPINAPIIQD